MESDSAFLGMVIGIPVGILSCVGALALVCRLNKEQNHYNNSNSSYTTRRYAPLTSDTRIIAQDIDILPV